MIDFYLMYILQDKYVLSRLVFLGFMAIEDAVAAVIPDPDAQGCLIEFVFMLVLAASFASML